MQRVVTGTDRIFSGMVVVTQLIYSFTTLSREITRFIIALGLNGPRADESRYLTPHLGVNYK